MTTLASRTLSLDDPACEDASVVGGKAAALARARRSGLPVLPGVVVPVTAAAAALAEGQRALASSGSGRARRATMQHSADASLLDELAERSAALGDRLIARSSAVVESGGEWAGAFSSFADVEPSELSTAVRGCWASTFGVDALERAEAGGVDVADAGMAVLIQPQVTPTFGGVATADRDGSVTIDVVAGSPAPLLQGWAAGCRAAVAPDGGVTGDAALELLGDARVADVARLATEAHRRTGRARIEWALTDDGLALLQVEPVPAARTPEQAHPVPGTGVVGDSALHGDTPLRVAAAVVECCGPLGEQYVLPWAVTTGVAERGASEPGAPASEQDAVAAWHTAIAGCRALTAAAWEERADPGAIVDELRAADPSPALAKVAETPPPDPGLVRAVWAAFATVAAHLVSRGVLSRPGDLWLAQPGAVEAAMAGGSSLPPPRTRKQELLGWQPFLHGVIEANGLTREGVAVVPGVAAGPAVRVRSAGDLSVAHPEGCIIVAQRPLPAISPLLWSAAGLVVDVENAAAHLLEVATSLGVPTVVGVAAASAGPPAGDGPGGSDLVAVDGYRATVTFAGTSPGWG